MAPAVVVAAQSIRVFDKGVLAVLYGPDPNHPEAALKAGPRMRRLSSKP